jgi:TetR/AcrR family transcriptional regulator, transcriptional repressor for nem operon
VGRPKEFDPEVAVDRALDVFWDSGYEATSVEDLSSAMGIGRRSLYDTFGSKHELYLRALDRYRERNWAALVGPLADTESARSGIRRMLTSIYQAASQDSRRRGCFFVNAATERAGHDPDVAARAADAFGQLRAALARSVARGQVTGEFRGGRSPDEVADMLLMLIQGLRVLGKAMPDQARLASSVDLALDML